MAKKNRESNRKQLARQAERISILEVGLCERQNDVDRIGLQLESLATDVNRRIGANSSDLSVLRDGMAFRATTGQLKALSDRLAVLESKRENVYLTDLAMAGKLALAAVAQWRAKMVSCRVVNNHTPDMSAHVPTEDDYGMLAGIIAWTLSMEKKAVV